MNPSIYSSAYLNEPSRLRSNIADKTPTEDHRQNKQPTHRAPQDTVELGSSRIASPPSTYTLENITQTANIALSSNLKHADRIQTDITQAKTPSPKQTTGGELIEHSSPESTRTFQEISENNIRPQLIDLFA